MAGQTPSDLPGSQLDALSVELANLLGVDPEDARRKILHVSDDMGVSHEDAFAFLKALAEQKRSAD